MPLFMSCLEEVFSDTQKIRLPFFVVQLSLWLLRNPSRLGTDGGPRQTARAARLEADAHTRV
jgi:hypothetical protein